MSGLISLEARAARAVALAAVESPASAYGLADAVVFALDAAGLLQTPEIAAELARLRGLAGSAPGVWHVFEEDTPRPVVPPLFASKAAAEGEAIARYEEMDGSCPDYSWRPGDDESCELLAGGDPVGIYLAPAPVHGRPDPADEPIPYELTAEVDRLRGENRGHVEHAGALLKQLRAIELGNGERSLLALALDLADDHVGVRAGEFTDEDRAALVALRRLAAAGGESP